MTHAESQLLRLIVYGALLIALLLAVGGAAIEWIG